MSDARAALALSRLAVNEREGFRFFVSAFEAIDGRGIAPNPDFPSRRYCERIT
jgi:hypothetical protein